MVWAGGDDPPPRGTGQNGKCCPDLGAFLQCLLADESIRQWLARGGVDPKAVAKCAQILRKENDG